MRKIIGSAIGILMISSTTVITASAVENQFGGYWRTRAFVQDEFKQDGGSYGRIDNRTRLYYTAKFNDDFKFVNKFEFNTNWGDENGGDVGADGTSIWKIKNSYADFNLANVNTKIGIQRAQIGRKFIFSDDFSGITITPKFGNVSLPFGYIAVQSEDGGGADFDEALTFIKANVKINDTIKVSPYFVYWAAGTGVDDEGLAVGDRETFYLGTDFDMKIKSASVWGTLIYNGGEHAGDDINAVLVAAGINAGMFHGQFFYATGDDVAAEGDNEAFVSSPGQSYYWSEIMGKGVFDNKASNGSPGNKVTNITALNAGVTFKPANKIKLTGDVWYAALSEENASGDAELGWEFDGKLTYALMDNLSADLVLAYLVAGDATGDEDVFEGGVRVSLKF